MSRDVHHTSKGWLEGSPGSDTWDGAHRGLQSHDAIDTAWHASEWLLGAMLLVLVVSATCVLAWLGREIITQAGIYDVLSAFTR